jgi:hypothetical protein
MNKFEQTLQSGGETLHFLSLFWNDANKSELLV